MTAFDTNIVSKVRKEIRRESLPLTEDISSFILGCELSESGSDIAFQVGWIGTKIGFSPDVDVLELSDSEAIGYEVKGIREGSVRKNQLYTGLGQAQLLLSSPHINPDENISAIPRIRRAYLAYPRGEADVGEAWEKSFINRVEKIPSVGIVDIKNDGVETIVEAEPNAPSRQECANYSGHAYKMCLNLHGDRLRKFLRENCDEKSVKNPDRSLEELALRIGDEFDINPVTFT